MIGKQQFPRSQVRLGHDPVRPWNVPLPFSVLNPDISARSRNMLRPVSNSRANLLMRFLSSAHVLMQLSFSNQAVHSSRSNVDGSSDSARCAGIQVANKPSNAIASTTPAKTSGSRGVA